MIVWWSEAYILAGRAAAAPFLTQAANTFGCDIYIQANESRVNVKNYEELQRTLGTQSGSAEMHFDGTDEQEAEIKFQQIAEE